MQLQYFDIVNANTHFHWDMTTSSNILKAKSNSFSGLPQLSDSSSVDSGVVIIKAFMNACKELGVSRDDASKIVGVDNSTLNRNKNKGFDPQESCVCNLCGYTAHCLLLRVVIRVSCVTGCIPTITLCLAAH